MDVPRLAPGLWSMVTSGVSYLQRKGGSKGGRTGTDAVRERIGDQACSRGMSENRCAVVGVVCVGTNMRTWMFVTEVAAANGQVLWVMTLERIQ